MVKYRSLGWGPMIDRWWVYGKETAEVHMSFRAQKALMRACAMLLRFLFFIRYLPRALHYSNALMY